MYPRSPKHSAIMLGALLASSMMGMPGMGMPCIDSRPKKDEDDELEGTPDGVIDGKIIDIKTTPKIPERKIVIVGNPGTIATDLLQGMGYEIARPVPPPYDPAKDPWSKQSIDASRQRGKEASERMHKKEMKRIRDQLRSRNGKLGFKCPCCNGLDFIVLKNGPEDDPIIYGCLTSGQQFAGK